MTRGTASTKKGTGRAASPLAPPDLERNLVRLVTALAAVAAVSFLAAGLIVESGPVTALVLGPLLVTLIGGVQIISGRERIVALLVVTAVIITMQNRLLGGPALAHASTVSLALIGMAIVVFIQARATVFIVSYCVFLFVTRVWWTGTDGAILFIEALVASLSFVFGAVVLLWMRRELERRSASYRHLFESAPVSLWEEDYSKVGVWLRELRSSGVVDLRRYLTEQPDELRRAASLIVVRDINDAAVRLSDAPSPEVLLGRIHAETFTPGALLSLIPQFLAIWNDEDRVTTEIEGGLSLTGKPIEALLVWSAPRTDGAQDLTRVTVAIVDITEQRSAERNLQEQIRAKDEFVAAVSHELRTPLTAVVGLAEELRDQADGLGTDERQELAGLIAGQSLEVSRIVEDLLVAARTEAGTLDVDVQRVDLEREVDAVLSSHGLKDDIPVGDAADIPAVLGDPDRIRQILRNLITNAQRYGGPHIRLAVREDGPLVLIEVRDDGEALPRAAREAIFDPYVRAKQRRGVTASVGLGLTVSRGLAIRMGGDLGYSHDGTETIFRLTLPAAPLPARERAIA